MAFWKRTLTAVLILGYVFGLVILSYFYGHFFVDILALSFALVAIYEMFHAFKSAGYNVMKAPVFFLAITMYLGYYLLEYYKGMGLLGYILSFVISCAVALVVFTFKNNRTLNDLFATIFIMVYPFLFLSGAFILSSYYYAAYSIMFAILLAVSTDSFAYWIGSIVKGKKLCPNISPKKTISGAIGGLLGGVVAALVFFFIFEYFKLLPMVQYVPFTNAPWKSALIYTAIGIVGAVVSQVGDIVASKLKRKMGIKDFGKIFPGHGGAMDRVDSIMFSIFFLLFCFAIIY